jgi:hypothetical protein
MKVVEFCFLCLFYFKARVYVSRPWNLQRCGLGFLLMLLLVPGTLNMQNTVCGRKTVFMRQLSSCEWLVCDHVLNMWADLQRFVCWTHCNVPCSSSTNRLITSKDHASVQLNVGHLDANGIYTGQFTTFALCGNVRAQVWCKMISACITSWHWIRFRKAIYM